MPSLLGTSDTTILIGFTKWIDPFTTYTYVGEAETLEGVLHRTDCDVDTSTCLFETVTPATTYKVGIRSCYTPIFGKIVCSPLSKTIDATTSPSGMINGNSILLPD